MALFITSNHDTVSMVQYFTAVATVLIHVFWKSHSKNGVSVWTELWTFDYQQPWPGRVDIFIFCFFFSAAISTVYTPVIGTTQGRCTSNQEVTVLLVRDLVRRANRASVSLSYFYRGVLFCYDDNTWWVGMLEQSLIGRGHYGGDCAVEFNLATGQ